MAVVSRPTFRLCAGAADEPWLLTAEVPQARVPPAIAPPPGLEAPGAASARPPSAAALAPHLGEVFSVLAAIDVPRAAARGGALAARLRPPAPAVGVGPLRPQRSAEAQENQRGASAVDVDDRRAASRVAPPRANAARCQGGSGADAAAKAPAKGPQTLSSSLRALANEDPDCLVIVRRINKLGFKASRILSQHFSAHGQVVRVLVAHSTVKQQGEVSSQIRRRPSSLGFVQMRAPEAVRSALAAGPEQDVRGATIRVQRFEHKVASAESMDDDGLAGDVDEEPVFEAVSAWRRQGTCESIASCATTASQGSRNSSFTAFGLEQLL